MSLPVEVAVCGEGPTDIAIARRLVSAAGGLPGVDLLGSRPGRGKSALDKRLPGLLAGAAFRPTLILRDLDTDAPCAGALIAALLPKPGKGLCLRIAVRSADAWLLADAAAFADAFGVRSSQIPREPESIANPKAAIAQLCRTSRRREIRLAAAGPVIEPQVLGLWLSDFARGIWDPIRASENGGAPSLARALRRVAEICRSQDASRRRR